MDARSLREHAICLRARADLAEWYRRLHKAQRLRARAASFERSAGTLDGTRRRTVTQPYVRVPS